MNSTVCSTRCGFFKNGKILPRRSHLTTLITADQCTLKITNQKNGRMGQSIKHETVANNDHGLVIAVARRIHHILSQGGSKENLICDYLNHNWVLTSVTPNDLQVSLRFTVRRLQLHNNRINPNLIGVHSLQTGGAMVIKLQGENDTTIMKQGHWTSMTFLQYIHNQIAHLSKNLSTKMSTVLTFQNVAAIKPVPPAANPTA